VKICKTLANISPPLSNLWICGRDWYISLDIDSFQNIGHELRRKLKSFVYVCALIGFNHIVYFVLAQVFFLFCLYLSNLSVSAVIFISSCLMTVSVSYLEWEIRTQHVHCTTVLGKSSLVQLRVKLEFTRKKFPLFSMLNQHFFLIILKSFVVRF
jgi:hypothetical protein